MKFRKKKEPDYKAMLEVEQAESAKLADRLREHREIVLGDAARIAQLKHELCLQEKRDAWRLGSFRAALEGIDKRVLTCNIETEMLDFLLRMAERGLTREEVSANLPLKKENSDAN